MTNVQYKIVIEPTSTGYSAFSPDLPGCIATGATREECVQNMKEAISFHIEGLRIEGEPVPPPVAATMEVEVAA
jgi:predicted RNase H-like HicB family nuclease